VGAPAVSFSRVRVRDIRVRKLRATRYEFPAISDNVDMKYPVLLKRRRVQLYNTKWRRKGANGFQFQNKIWLENFQSTSAKMAEMENLYKQTNK
jgi:hypothetical protein